MATFTRVGALAVVLALTACAATSEKKPEETAPAAKPAEAPKPAMPEVALTPASAATMASNCYTCHGPNGNSPGTIPKINHLSADNILDMLKAFKSGARPSTVMARHGKGYSDNELAAIAKAIASANGK
jgi:sulfide dehydrogenase cytochrome subunit